MRGAFRKIGWVVLGLFAVAQAGCLGLAVCGACAGAGAAGYVWFQGKLYRDYRANLGEAVVAVRAALTELQFVIIEEKPDTGSVFFRSKTGDGQALRVYLDTVPSAVPAEPTVTRVGVRVGYSGDDAVSARILDEVSKRLLPAGQVPIAPAPTAPPAPVLGAPRPAETAAPPLASPNERLTPVAASEPR